MYPAALHRFPPQTIDSSKVLKGDFSKATKDKQQDAKKLVKEDSQRSGTGFSQIGPQFSLLIVVVKEKFASIKNIFLIIIYVIRSNFYYLYSHRILDQCKSFNYVVTEKTLHKTKLRNLKAALLS